MNKGYLITGMMIFIIGWTLGSLNLISKENFLQTANSDFSSYFEQLASDNSVSVLRDIPSPKERISREQVFVYNNQVILEIDNPQWAVFADTNSMDPVIDSQSKAIEVIPKSPDEIQVGDILAYQSSYSDSIIAHRVVEIGKDSKGWFVILKGDNNDRPDPEKVRFDQVKRVVVAIIY